MMSPQLIREISDHAAYEAAQEDKIPLSVWHSDDLRHMPFLGTYVPSGWRAATWSDIEGERPRNARYDDAEGPANILVDASGWGAPDEPALTFEQLASYVGITPGFGWAIKETGQFQIVVGIYVEDGSSEGTPAPELEPCDECRQIHGPLDECDPDEVHAVEGHRWVTEDIADGVVGGGRAHVYVTYCSVCNEEREDEDQDEEPEERWAH